MILSALMLLQAVATVDATEPALPPDARKFLLRYEECEHWLGEEPYDEARRRQIDRAVNKVCRGIDRAATRLRAKHPTNMAVDRLLVEHPPLNL